MCKCYPIPKENQREDPNNKFNSNLNENDTCFFVVHEYFIYISKEVGVRTHSPKVESGTVVLCKDLEVWIDNTSSDSTPIWSCLIY